MLAVPAHARESETPFSTEYGKGHMKETSTNGYEQGRMVW